MTALEIVKCQFIIPELTIRHYIKRLKPGAAPGSDGITGEHLKTAMNSKLPLHLSNLLSTCVRFGVIPDHFCHGLLIPILKKRTLDPSIPKSYRPITVSAIVSKILEQYIIDKCDEYRHNEAQFGLITNRSTSMASALAHNIGMYCLSKGSTIFYCSLDAEGMYDALPHSVLLQKTMNIIPDNLWRLLHFWYSHKNVVRRLG